MSIDPTSYDLQQDSRIDALNEIITTSYEEPSQIEYSYPVVDQPMNDEQWQYVTLGIGDGVLDEGGRPYWLRLNGTEANTNSTNTMLLTVSTTVDTAQAALKGFYHRLMADKVLHFEGVTTETTYYVVLRYDPLDHDKPTGPISVQVVTSLDYTQGKHYVVLWTVKRKPNQLLTDAEVKNLRQKVTPIMQVDTRDQLPDVKSQLWGTVAVVSTTSQGAEIIRAGGTGSADGGPTEWVSLTDPEWIEHGDTSGYKWPGFGYPRAQRRKGRTVELRGVVERANSGTFEAGNRYHVFMLREENIPERSTYFMVAGSSATNPKFGRLLVAGRDAGEETPGGVYVFPKENASWFSIDNVQFDVR